MMYLVEGEPLEWFRKTTTHSVECKAGQVRVMRNDKPQSHETLSDAELAEMLGNFVYSETGDYYFARQIVVDLAWRLGIEDLLRAEDDDE